MDNNTNFISEMVAFDRWLETNYLPDLSQLLWYKLFMLNNRCGWAEWITVDNQRLMAIMQMKREATFIETRNKLIEAGLIKFKRGSKGHPNQYHINTFKCEVKSVVNTVVNTEVKSVVNTVAQTVDINKHKQNNIYSAGARRKNKNRFNNFEQRNTDNDNLELTLLSNNQ